MTAFRTLQVLVISGIGLVKAAEVATATCGLHGQDHCPQQRRGQAMLQHHAGGHQQVGAEQLDPKQHTPQRSTAYVQVGVSGISLPPQLAMWTDSSAGLLQLQDKARQKAAASKQSPPDAGSVEISQWIADTLIPQAQLTIQQLNNEINGAYDEVSTCQTSRKQAEDGIADDKTFLAGAESQRSACEVTSAENHKAAVLACQELKDFYMGIEAPAPSLKSMVEGANATKDLDAIYTNMGIWVGFYKDKNVDFSAKRTECANWNNGDAHTATECLEDRRGIEKSYCSLTKAQMDICSDFKGCYQEKAAAFDKVEADVRKLETHVKENFKAMSCWNMEGENHCDPTGVDVGHLNVDFKKKPPMGECTADIGTAWNYSHVDCPELRVFEESEAVATETPPPAPPAAAPPPAPPAPTTAPAPPPAATTAPTPPPAATTGPTAPPNSTEAQTPPPAPATEPTQPPTPVTATTP